MKIATYNVNGIKSRLPNLLAWLAREKPDVACLQELKALDDSFPRQELADAGYHVVWRGQRSWNGVAILSREPAQEIRRELPGDPGDDHSRYIEARVEGIVVVSLYLPNGNPQPGPRFDYKLAWFDRLIAHARTLSASGAAVVLAGDFNVVPTDGDIYNAWAWREDAVMQPASRDAWRRLLAQGWTDATRRLHPGETIYTYWVNAFAFQRNAGFRMDFLLLNPVLAERLQAAGVDTAYRGRERPSDHAPTWITLSDAPMAGSRRTPPPGTR
jgi:exodeoxyribonuclease III